MPSDTNDDFTPRTQSSFLDAEAAIELEEAAVLHEHKNISDDYDRFNEQSRGESRRDAAATKRIAVEQLEDEACSRDCRHPLGSLLSGSRPGRALQSVHLVASGSDGEGTSPTLPCRRSGTRLRGTHPFALPCSPTLASATDLGGERGGPR